MHATERSSGALRRLLPAILAVCAFMCAFAVAAAAASAATFTVNSTADEALEDPSSSACATAAHTCTLRAAVQAADNAGGASTIELPAGEYKLTIEATSEAGSEEDPAKGDLDVLAAASLTINGAGSGATTINANHIDRAFAVHKEASLSLSGVSIKNGSQPDEAPSDNSIEPGSGGAIYNAGSLTVTDSALTYDKSYDDGGAIYSSSEAKLTSISGSRISHDVATYADGGGLYVDAGRMSISNSTFNYDSAPGDYAGALETASSEEGTISNSTFEHDSSSYGAAVSDDGSGSLRIEHSTIAKDSTSSYDEYTGGVAAWSSSGPLSLTDSTVSNDSGGYGGGLFLEGSEPVTLTGDTFAGNVSTYYYGGAIYDDRSGEVKVQASTFTANNAYYGAAIYYEGSSMSLENDTFDSNSGTYGGATYLDKPGVSMLNDTLAHNTAYEGGAIYETTDLSSVANTIVAENTPEGCESGPVEESADKGGNIGSDGSCFAVGGTGSEPVAPGDQPNVEPMLGALADNGGPTQTDALLAGSPAIGRAISALCPETDQRGVPRPEGGCDVGAFQTAAAGLSLTDSAPATIAAGTPLTYTLTVTGSGPGVSTGTTLTSQLPAGGTLYGATPSQGACTSEGSPAKVTCELGVLEPGKSATVTILATLGTPGSAMSTATATNEEGASAGASATTTVTPVVSGVKIAATTGAAASIGNNAATLTGSLAGVSSQTSYFFQYGRSAAYGLATAAQSTSSSGAVSAAIAGLRAGTTYHYRLVAINGGGISYGADRTFTTTGTAKVAVKQCVVPKLHGLRLKRARKALRAAGCRVGKVIRRQNAKTRRGHVVFANPHHGTTLKAGRKIRLFVSKGRRHKHHRRTARAHHAHHGHGRPRTR